MLSPNLRGKQERLLVFFPNPGGKYEKHPHPNAPGWVGEGGLLPVRIPPWTPGLRLITKAAAAAPDSGFRGGGEAAAAFLSESDEEREGAGGEDSDSDSDYGSDYALTLNGSVFVQQKLKVRSYSLVLYAFSAVALCQNSLPHLRFSLKWL